MTFKAALAASISIFALASAPALAEDAPEYHGAESSDIIVSAPIQRDRMDVLSGVSVLSGSRLTTALRPTIGETIEHTPGVSATSFGPNASRPVLRGLQGERVRVLTDGVGSTDVSNTSVDHAVVINPLLAERVEVLRGPEALLYGSAAIGGVVNVIDRRIPRAIPDEALHVDAIATYGSAANERSGAVSLDAPIGGGFVAHVDGSYLKTGDLRIGGYVLSPLGRPTGAGAWLEGTAGLIVAAIGALYVVLSLRGLRRPVSHDHGAEGSRPFLAVAMGLLPCPLTIIVVGFAINRGATLAGIVLAAGISVGAAVTIGCFGLLGIALRRGGIVLLGGDVHRLLKGLAWLEVVTSVLILTFGLFMLAGVAGRIR
jgi:hypothetical protein